MHYAIVQDRLDMVELLLASGADPNINDAYGYTSLDLAVEFSRTAMLPLLRNHGGMLDMMDSSDLEHAERPTEDR